MNRFSSVSSTSVALFSHFIKHSTSFSTFSSSSSLLPSSLSFFCKSKAHLHPISLQFTSTRFFSSTRKPSSRTRKSSTTMDEDKDAFYVLRKGDIVGVYKNLSDCQAQAGTSVCDPSASVYKGYSLPKETEEYLASRGLKNALYSVSASDVNEDLFGALVPCPFQQPTAKGKAKRSLNVLESDNNVQPAAKAKAKRSQDVLESNEDVDIAWSSSFCTDTARKQVKLDNSIKAEPGRKKCVSCTLEFDGASKGNPGRAGAGAILRADDGSLVIRLREGVGIATNNVAEYRAFILGLKRALSNGFRQIRAQGDSKLVCMQVQGRWKAKHENMAALCKEAKELMKEFVSFQIDHVLRILFIVG